MPEEEIKSPLQPDAEGNVVETDAPVVEPDLDALRDEKCFPVARTMFADIATDMVPEDANEKIDYNPIVIKLLSHSFEADLNLTTENPYVIQLMLGVLSGLNGTVQECDILPIDDVRFGRISRSILQIVSEANVTLGTVTPEQTKADFAPVKEKLNTLFAEEKLTWLEVKYIMDAMFEAFTAVNTAFSSSIETSLQKTEEKILGVEHMSDITMKKLDAVLKGQ